MDEFFETFSSVATQTARSPEQSISLSDSSFFLQQRQHVVRCNHR